MHLIEYCCDPIPRSGYLLTHHFIRIDNHDLHLGRYNSGKIWPYGQSRGRCYQKNYACDECYVKFINWINSKNDVNLFQYCYPIVNCETLVRGYSPQFNIFLVSAVFTIACLFFKYFTLLIPITLVTLLLLLLININVRYGPVKLSYCKHLSSKQQ